MVNKRQIKEKEKEKTKRQNKSQIKYTPPGEKLVYNLFSSMVIGSIPIKDMSYYPNDSENINRTSEVLVRVPHLTPKYFVKCT